MKTRSEPAAHRVRNPFYDRVRREGIRIVAAIESLPHGGREVSNPYYERIRQLGGLLLPTRRGRPRKGEGARPTEVKTVRLPPEVWQKLEDRAERVGVSRNAALREAILRWLE